MEDFRKKTTTEDDRLPTSRLEGEAYPATVEKMSERWRALQQEHPAETGAAAPRKTLAWGLGIGLLLVLIIIIVGGFAFLIWNAR